MKRSRIKWIIVASLVYLLYIMVAKHFFIANIIFGSAMLILVYTFAGLVKSGKDLWIYRYRRFNRKSFVLEKVTLVRNFGLQTSTSFAFGKVSNLLIPNNCLEEIVINEVIYNVNSYHFDWISFICLKDSFIQLKVIYVLDVLTKGSICKEKPIITLFSVSFNLKKKQWTINTTVLSHRIYYRTWNVWNYVTN